MKLPRVAVIVLNRVVQQDAPPPSLVYGNPAPWVGTVERWER